MTLGPGGHLELQVQAGHQMNSRKAHLKCPDCFQLSPSTIYNTLGKYDTDDDNVVKLMADGNVLQPMPML